MADGKITLAEFKRIAGKSSPQTKLLVCSAVQQVVSCMRHTDQLNSSMTNQDGSLLKDDERDRYLTIFLEKAVRVSKRLSICPVTQHACFTDLVQNRIVGVLKVFLHERLYFTPITSSGKSKVHFFRFSSMLSFMLVASEIRMSQADE